MNDLITSSKNGDLDRVQDLIKNNNYTMDEILDAFLESIRNQHLKLVEYFIDIGVELIETDLLLSLEVKDFEISEYIINFLYPMEIDRVFIYLAKNKNIDFKILDFLIKHGANVKYFNSISLIENAERENLRVVKYLMKFYTQHELQELNIPEVNQIQRDAIRKIRDITLPWLYRPERKSKDNKYNNLIQKEFEKVEGIYHQSGNGSLNKLCKRCNINYRQNNKQKYRDLSRYFKKLSLY
jgi:hypothetical protein